MTISAPSWADAADSPWPATGPGARSAVGSMVRAAVGTSRAGRAGAVLGPLSPAAQVLAALALMTALQLAALPSQDPVRTVVSMLVYAPGGIVLFPLAAGLIAVAAFAWARQLARLGRPWAARFAAAAGVGLLLLGAFPTDPPGAIGISLAAQVHRYAALSIFIAIPAAAVLGHLGGRAARDAGARRRLRGLRVSVAICLLAAGPALLGIFPGLLPDAWQRFAVGCDAVRGLVERAQLVTMTVIVILGVALSRGDRGRRTRASDREPSSSGRPEIA